MASTIITNAYTSAEVVELVSRTGTLKGNMPIYKIFLSSVSAGALISFAAASSVSVQASPWYLENATGLIRTVSGLVFPYGLVLIIFTGADLFTGTLMFTTIACLHGRLSVWKVLLHWFICFWGNLAGALFMVSIIFGYGGVFDLPPYRTEAVSYATAKQITPQWHQIFLRAIGANWLVCLAIFFAIQGRDLVSKIAGIWGPIFGFVSLGLDHVVANMFFIPMGIWLETPGITIPLYIWKGIIPAGLGNILGGALFCGGYYWFMFLYDQPPIPIDGVFYHPANTTTSNTNDHDDHDDYDRHHHPHQQQQQQQQQQKEPPKSKFHRQHHYGVNGQGQGLAQGNDRYAQGQGQEQQRGFSMMHLGRHRNTGNIAAGAGGGGGGGSSHSSSGSSGGDGTQYGIGGGGGVGGGRPTAINGRRDGGGLGGMRRNQQQRGHGDGDV